MSVRKERYQNAALQTLFVVFCSTFGMWFTYLVIEFLFNGVIADLKWPGINSFIGNGSFLTITFSMLTTIILTTSANLKLNWYNGIAIILLIVTTLLYMRCIGLNGRVDFTIPGTAPFALSVPLLFLSFKDKNSIFRRYSWLGDARNETYYYDIFLSFAIAGNKNQAERDDIERKIAILDETFKECRYKSIFNASKYFDSKHNKINPPEAAKEDFSAIENSKNFVLFYPETVPSSALMELGYALKDKRNILIISKDQETLPFLARGISEIHRNVRSLFFEDFDDLINDIKTNHRHYLKK